jgi:hypothetical protein
MLCTRSSKRENNFRVQCLWVPVEELIGHPIQALCGGLVQRLSCERFVTRVGRTRRGLLEEIGRVVVGQLLKHVVDLPAVVGIV